MSHSEDPRQPGIGADVFAEPKPGRRLPIRGLLVAASIALFAVGVAFGTPVGPRAGQPDLDISPIVRRSFGDAQGAPRVAATPFAKPLANGSLREESIYSQTLGREMPIGIYLPPGHEGSERRYPVLYALHGAAGYYAEWVDFGAATAADSLISNSLAPPFMMVFPQGDQSYWFNHPQGGDAWADFVTEEVIPWVDTFYPTLRGRNARAIGGLSMGAVGALQFGLRRPDLFGTVGSHSPSFRNRPDNEIFWYFANTQNYAGYDPFALALSSGAKNRTKVWIDVGDKDPWRPRATEFHNLLTERNWAHRWDVGKGIHEGSYWGSRMPEYLSFYAYSLAQPGDTAPP